MSIRRAFFDKNQFFCLTRHILLVQHYEFSIFDTNLDMVFQSSGVRASDDFLFLLQKSTIRKEGKQCPQPATPQSTTKFCATERFPRGEGSVCRHQVFCRPAGFRAQQAPSRLCLLGQRLPAECGVEGAQAKGIPAALFLPGGKWCVLSCLQPDAAPVRAGGLRLFPVHRPPER